MSLMSVVKRFENSMELILVSDDLSCTTEGPKAIDPEYDSDLKNIKYELWDWRDGEVTAKWHWDDHDTWDHFWSAPEPPTTYVRYDRLDPMTILITDVQSEAFTEELHGPLMNSMYIHKVQKNKVVEIWFRDAVNTNWVRNDRDEENQ